jgi:hypothetical protein
MVIDPTGRSCSLYMIAADMHIIYIILVKSSHPYQEDCLGREYIAIAESIV